MREHKMIVYILRTQIFYKRACWRKRSFCQPFLLFVFKSTTSIDFSCGECGKEVSDDDKAIQCESDCMRGFHAYRMNLSDDDYDELSETDTIWECGSYKLLIYMYLNLTV